MDLKQQPIAATAIKPRPNRIEQTAGDGSAANETMGMAGALCVIDLHKVEGDSRTSGEVWAGHV